MLLFLLHQLHHSRHSSCRLVFFVIRWAPWKAVPALHANVACFFYSLSFFVLLLTDTNFFSSQCAHFYSFIVSIKVTILFIWKTHVTFHSHCKSYIFLFWRGLTSLRCSAWIPDYSGHFVTINTFTCCWRFVSVESCGLCCGTCECLHLWFNKL